ncbi:hypothetical protein IKF67_01940 [Candidatus Saccharibacteria bacterium]|nr:hypothetical protein [Candidatus Saccharibacteria bacterium]
MAREINLVPDIKGEMIKTLKLRNLIFFLCVIVAIASTVITILFGLIVGGQQLALTSKQDAIKSLSAKLNSYSDLNDFLTIKDQLSNISTIANNKQVLSRTFNTLSALLPTGADKITISELSVNLSGDQPTFSFDAQANAGQEPFIDYNVLDSFKKSMQYMRYDYGNYVDKSGNTIPAYCIIEHGDDGSLLSDSSRGLYAFWTIDEEGCNPTKASDTSDTDADPEKESDIKQTTKQDSYSYEEYNGKKVVRIWRTPQFSDWYKEKETEGKPYMSLDGVISNVEHFESACITYTGDNSQSSANPKWTESNESCHLIPADTDGIKISESSNGKGASDELVLRFSATISLAPEVYKFSNHHVIAIPPSGRRNVTDSYVQIQAMFGERAADCEEGDTSCNNKANEGEE